MREEVMEMTPSAPENLLLILQNIVEKILPGGSDIFTNSSNKILMHRFDIVLIQNLENIDVKIHALVDKDTPLRLYYIYEIFVIKNM